MLPIICCLVDILCYILYIVQCMLYACIYIYIYIYTHTYTYYMVHLHQASATSAVDLASILRHPGILPGRVGRQFGWGRLGFGV